MMIRRAFRKTILSVAMLLIVSSAVYGATPEAPKKASYLGVFNVLEAWGPFGLLGADEPSAKQAKALPLVQVLDSSGRALALAQWEGEAPKVSKDGKEWSITLSATIMLKKHSFELRSAINEGTKLYSGRIELTLAYNGDASEAAKYRYLLKLPGAGAWASKDGLAAAISSIDGYSGSLSQFIAVAVADGSASLKAKQISKVSDKKEERKLFLIEASSTSPKTGETPKQRIMTLYMTKVSCWAQEPVLALAGAMVSEGRDPDLRLFGTADKQSVSPGESLEYTYYVFNSGMDEAADLSITIPISNMTSLIKSSIYGSPGKARLMPSGEEIEVTAERSETITADGAIKTILWKPARNLMPGETMKISFSVVI